MEGLTVGDVWQLTLVVLECCLALHIQDVKPEPSQATLFVSVANFSHGFIHACILVIILVSYSVCLQAGQSVQIQGIVQAISAGIVQLVLGGSVLLTGLSALVDCCADLTVRANLVLGAACRLSTCPFIFIEHFSGLLSVLPLAFGRRYRFKRLSRRRDLNLR